MTIMSNADVLEKDLEVTPGSTDIRWAEEAYLRPQAKRRESLTVRKVVRQRRPRIRFLVSVIIAGLVAMALLFATAKPVTSPSTRAPSTATATYIQKTPSATSAPPPLVGLPRFSMLFPEPTTPVVPRLTRPLSLPRL